MKKISLLIIMLMSIAMTALAQSTDTVPIPQIWGDNYYIYQRTSQGSAVNPADHRTLVAQDGTFEIATADGGFYVYIKNIVYGSKQEFGDYWVLGYDYNLDGRITVPFDQPIYVQTRDGLFVKSNRRASLAWGTVTYNSVTHEVAFVRDATVTEVTYTMDGKTIHIEHTDGPVAIDALEDVSYEATGLGIVWEDEETTEDDYEWAGYCEWGTEVDTTPYVINWQPEGELKTYTRTSECIHYTNAVNRSAADPTFWTEYQSGSCQVVYAGDGRTVYLKDPIQSLQYGTWVKGTLDDSGFITVELPQYLYCYDSGEVVSLAMGYCTLYQETLIDGSSYEAINAIYSDDYKPAYFKIEGNTLTLMETRADIEAPYPSNYTATGLHAYDMLTNVGAIEANVVYTLETDTPEDPAEKTSEPTFHGFTTDGIHAYFVEIKPTEPSTIYYRYQYNGGAFNEWAEYDEVLSFTADGMYLVEAYAQAPGKLASTTVAHEFEVSKSTGVSEIIAGKQAVSVRYYNMMGQEMPAANGMTIIITTYSDGTTTSTKVMK